jgi:hypothetical protein
MSALFSPVLAMFSGMTEYASKGTMQFLVELLAISLIGLAVLWLGIKRPWSKGVVTQKTTRDEQVIVKLYGRMVQHLVGKGIPKPTTTGPLEFVRTAQAKWSDANSAVASITELYCRTRFGQIPLTKEELSLAEDHLRQLMALDKP